MPFRAIDATALADRLKAESLPIPDALARALHIREVLESTRQVPEGPLLNLDDEAILNHAKAIALHWATRGTSMESIYVDVINYTEDAAFEEAAAALRSGEVDEIITALRPTFDKAAAVVHDAIKVGIHSNTTAADVLEMRNPEATKIWFSLAAAIDTLTDIASTRKLLSESLDLPPTVQDSRHLNGLSGFDYTGVDWSVCYAKGDNFTTNVPTLRWLDIARAGLRLNTPSEVATKYANTAHKAQRPLVVNGIGRVGG